MYRGTGLRNEHVDIYTRVEIDDTACGKIDTWPTLFKRRYFCRLWEPQDAEDTRDDEGERSAPLWRMFGERLRTIRVGFKVMRTKTGQEFIITNVDRPYDGRAPAHMQCTLREVKKVEGYEGAGS
jgi:hypothetical protein